jgi:transposase
VWHDDHRGTAAVVLAALLNALEIVGKRLNAVRIALIGIGAANMAVYRLLRAEGVAAGAFIACDSCAHCTQGAPTGLYMSPPCHAVVLSIDEKSQIQALDRTQPGLPLKPGKCATMTHDYKRNGTTTLFAALNVLDGTGRCMKRHRHQEFIKFLNAVERKVKAGKIIHVILDNYGTHKHLKVDQWLANHPRWVFHFTPTSASWLNAVEGFFSAITRRRIRRGVFTSVADLEDAIKRYITDHNRHAKPFVWTKTADEIFEKLNRLELHLLNESVH